MASSIDTSTIDANYPVAGIDNDSQGFRDNFNSIKTNITTAGSEITALQANRARIDADNNHVGNEIQDAELLQVTEVFNNSNQSLTADHNSSHQHMEVTLDFGHRLKQTYIKLLKLYFTPITQSALKMVHCVKLRDSYHLFVYGQMVCYNKWQLIVITVILPGIFLFPV